MLRRKWISHKPSSHLKLYPVELIAVQLYSLKVHYIHMYFTKDKATTQNRGKVQLRTPFSASVGGKPLFRSTVCLKRWSI